MKTYFIETWGCQMNRHDSGRLEAMLRELGLEPAPAAEDADLVLLNTCSVRDKPVQKLVSRIGALSRSQRASRIGVCGCVAQQEGDQLLRRSPAVAFVLGPGQVGRLGDALRGVADGARPVITGFDREPVSQEAAPAVVGSSACGLVTVSEGCDERCTFCVVPYTRGGERSRPLESILSEVLAIERTGLRAVELLGQTINAYRCPTTGAGFPELLEAVAGSTGLERVRYITSHPRHFDDRLIRVVRSHRNLSTYLHLPVQAGSDRVLRRMHRRYTRVEYLDLVRRIRDAVPEICLSSDLIVGFPGEDEADLEASIDLLEQVRFGSLFAFAFSPRPGTPAARYPQQLPLEVKQERLQRVLAVANRITLELNQELVGRTARVLIDGDSRRSPDQWQGRGEDNRIVNFPKSRVGQLGDIVPVRITRAGPHSLAGEAITGSAAATPG